MHIPGAALLSTLLHGMVIALEFSVSFMAAEVLQSGGL